jgi:hypothetical protein
VVRPYEFAEPIHGEPVKPRVRVKALSVPRFTDTPVVRVLALGDVHTKPGRTVEHLSWIGRHAAATRPDRLVCIGDFLSLDSLSNHPPKGSERDSGRPSFVADLEAGEEGLHAIDREYPDGQRDITLGNHEKRAWTAADMDPRRASDMPLRVEQLFARYRWRTHDYGKYLSIGGVRFVHVPINQMGREYGGKHSENTISNDLMWSLVWGHDHRGRFKTTYKIGDNNEKINLCNLGTAMPNHVVEDYSVGVTGWTYGAWDLRVKDGLIISAKFIDMEELRERYGD